MSESEESADGSSQSTNMDQVAGMTEMLHQWYGRLSSRRVDLVGDYAGKELFLLEGDSLLLHCLADPKLDFDDGFQLLHAVYAVEHFLSGLVKRHCNFHVVFFDTHRNLCIPRGVAGANGPKHLLARSVIQRHLKINLQQANPPIRVETFRSPRDADFHNYLQLTGVYFIMCHDGASVAPSSVGVASPREDQETALTESFEELERYKKIKYRSFILILIKRGYNVALINGLEFIDTKVMTMVVESSKRSLSQSEVPHEETSGSEQATDVKDSLALDRFLSKLQLQQSGDLKCQCSSTIKLCADPTERVIATLIVLDRMLHEELVTMSLATSFLIHIILVGSIPLHNRRLKMAGGHDGPPSTMNAFLSDLSKLVTMLFSTKAYEDFMQNRCVPCDISDLIDGRLLESVLSRPDQRLLNDEDARRFEEVAHLLCAISGKHLKLPNASSPMMPASRTTNDIMAGDMSISSFSNPVFDKHLSSISLQVSSTKSNQKMPGRIYQEISHWHNAKRRLDPKQNQSIPTSEKEKIRALRRNQFFMAEMQSYAASLTNAAGKQLEPEIMTVSESNNLEVKKVNKPAQSVPAKTQKGKVSGNRKGNEKQARLDDLAAKKATKDTENDEKSFAAWRTVRKSLESERNLEAQYLKIKAYLHNSPESKRIVLQAEVECHLLYILYEIYRGHRKQMDSQQPAYQAKEEFLGVAALIWDTCRRLAMMDGLTDSISELMKRVIAALDLPDPGFTTPAADRKLAYDVKLILPKGNELAVGLTGKDFQLLHCGPYMDRNLDSAPDPRVPFHPDGWQRQVLDELDAQKSVLVVAPTSAGKTFISFYAMEKVLRANDDGVLVYVAPTKALVNQIAAEIQARFKKNYKHAGKSVWAIHTRDYRINNPLGCQILVTVPHILQIMLLAPSNAKSWSPRVRYIIFDEIHSIGQAEDGVVWEQLLLLAPCPIIALSATVGNPGMFHSWLNATQESHGSQVTMVQHQHRYSDLRKFVFNPPKKFAFRGLEERPSFATLGLDGLAGLKFVHPVSSLVNKSRGMPDDLSLEARDCLSLFNSMKRHANSDYVLDPGLDRWQQGDPQVIRKADIIEWERQLKAQLKTWMADSESPFDAVREDLSKSLDESSSIDKEVSKGSTNDDIDDFYDVSPDDLYATTLPLLCKLQQRDALPAIFFNYDRHKCENIAKALLQQLSDAEKRWKDTSPGWRAKLVAFEKWKLEKEKLGNKRVPKVAPKKKGKNDGDDDPPSKSDKIQDAASEESNPFANFDPDAPIDGFHFAAKHRTPTELYDYLWQMKRRGLAPWLSLALLRGIGVHHAGMNRKYRQVVEMLFRQGYLTVVIATGTLALGINMPCATVVFSGDSIFLTALNFRQAAGRAGRRGFDLLGNVVFQNVSHGKICRLLSSRLPDLNGHFPVTTTLVLRLFTLLHESGNSPYAIRAINSLLSQPRLYLDGPAFKDQVLHHLRFSIEYLRRQELLGPYGAPINFAGLTSHLYFTENSSFALNALLKGGYFHDLCADINDKESHVLRTLMIVMAHLFGRRPCREADAEYIENIVKRSPSVVFLPPLPAGAVKVLRDHNDDTLQVFTTYVRTFVDQHIDTPDNTLPLTNLKFGSEDGDMVVPESLPPAKVRSSFVALSGHDDKFESISDLCRTTRDGVFLEEAVVPHLDIYPDESKTPLNAYLYDFFMHGDLETLDKANGVKRADVWFLLNDFSLVLATFTTSLANFLKLPESDLSLADVIGEGDENNNAVDDKFAGDSTDTDSVATSTATTDTGRTSLTSSTSTGSKPKATKKKIADSWEDSEEEEESEPEQANGSVENNPTAGELESGFLNVYKAMLKLRSEFDTKFRKIFA